MIILAPKFFIKSIFQRGLSAFISTFISVGLAWYGDDVTMKSTPVLVYWSIFFKVMPPVADNSKWG